MQISFKTATQPDKSAAQSWQADCVLVPVLDGIPFLQNIPALAAQLPWLSESIALNDFKAKKGENCLVYAPGKQNAQIAKQDLPIARVLFCGLGKSSEFKPMFLRDAVALAVKTCAGLKLAHLALPLEALEALSVQLKTERSAAADASGFNKELKVNTPGFAEVSALLEEAVLGAQLALYSCDLYRGKAQVVEQGEENNRFKPAKLDLLCPKDGLPEVTRFALIKATALADGIYQARDLINGPANIVTPSHLEAKAQELARTYGFNCTSLGPDYLRDSGFGAFWGVARGSSEEPRLLILEYKPQPATTPNAENADSAYVNANAVGNANSEDEAPIIIVGKGITFDSGGLSLKPAAKMHEMKSDMAGAGTVLGLFAALGEALKTLSAKHVIGIMPCSDNMPDGNAYHPGDILTTLSGKTVEIISTDAEGRLLLCDCLTLAQRRWKPSALIDVATLTGACVIALGEHTTGLFGNNAALRERILELGERCSERFWPLPIYDEDIDGLKSSTADLLNTGPREGSALFAALFLKQFIEPGTAWAHLDIAGPAYTSKKSPANPDGGASGVALRTLFELIIQN